MREGSPFQVFRVKAVLRETDNTKTFTFDNSLDASPGQFVMAWLPGVGEKPFCVADAQPLAITIADIGAFSHALHQLKPGGRVWIRGPFGQGFTLNGSKHLLVGGGYGAAPLYFLARTARALGQEVAVCLGARTGADLLMQKAFHEIECDVVTATDDGSAGIKGVVTDAVQQVLTHYEPDCLYACGPLAMLSAVAKLCRARLLPVQLSYEALMRCGIGLCGSCELDEDVRLAANIPPGWLTCKDGPVFTFNPRY